MNALSLLRNGELCIIVLHDGRRFEAAWDAETRRFRIEGQDDPISSAEVYEWLPAGVKF